MLQGCFWKFGQPYFLFLQATAIQINANDHYMSGVPINTCIRVFFARGVTEGFVTIRYMLLTLHVVCFARTVRLLDTREG